MEEKEDLRNRIYKCLDRMGRYHIFLLSAFITFTLTAGYSNTVAVFYTFTPKFYCGIQDDPNDPQWNQCGNAESPANCTFDPHENYDSIVTEYHLVCANRYLAPLTSTMYFAGVTIGALVFGPLSDSIGRRRTLQITTTGHILMGLLIHFEKVTPTIIPFIVLRFIQGGLNQGMQTIAYTSLIELTPVKFRTLMGCIWEAFWSMGLIYVAAISTFTFEWRTLQLYMLIPTGLGVVATFLIPESLHWHWTKNRFGKVIATYSKIAERNGDGKFMEEEREFQRGKNWESIEEKCQQLEADGEASVGTLSMISMIFKSPILRRHILIMSFFWFSVTVCYYAITFFVPNLGGNRHTNILTGGAIELVGMVALYFAMTQFGRSKVLGIFAIISASLFLVYAIVQLTGDMEAETRETAGIVLLLIAKSLALSAFAGMYISTGELFPTICRGTTFGYCGFWSRFGSLIAPQIVSATEVVNPALPMFLLGGLLIVAGGLMFVLPETLKIQIPNTMQDVETLWGKKRKEVEISRFM